MTITINNKNKKPNVPNSTDKGNVIRNVPHLRFPEFEGEWEKCKLGDYGKVVTGNTPPTKDIENYENGTYLWASPADLGTIKSITETKTMLSAQGFSKTRTLPKGSVLVTCIGSTIGKAGMATKEMSTNQQINSIVVNDNNDNEFVYYAIQSAFPRYLSSIAVQAVPIISKSAFELLPNNRPYLQEQKKIGKFLSMLDERIATQNKIIDKLQSLIKGIAHKVSKQGKPNIRLSECLLCTSSTLQESDVAEVGAYPVYGANGIVGYLDTYNTTSEAIYIIKDGSGVGAVSCVKGKCSATGTLNILQTKEGFSLRYLYFILKVFSFEPYKTGMAIPHIYFKDYGKAKIYCPSNQLQCKYADLLSKIEQKATAEQKILDNLCSQKQYLLCQMFI